MSGNRPLAYVCPVFSSMDELPSLDEAQCVEIVPHRSSGSESFSSPGRGIVPALGLDATPLHLPRLGPNV